MNIEGKKRRLLVISTSTSLLLLNTDIRLIIQNIDASNRLII